MGNVTDFEGRTFVFDAEPPSEMDYQKHENFILQLIDSDPDDYMLTDDGFLLKSQFLQIPASVRLNTVDVTDIGNRAVQVFRERADCTKTMPPTVCPASPRTKRCK